MKIIFQILSIIFPIILKGQPEYTDTTKTDTAKSGTIKIEKKYTEADFFPRINGKFDGNIDPFEICTSEGIVTNAGIKITSFELHTFNGNQEVAYKIQGNTIPAEYCEKLAKMPEGDVVYFRNIKGLGKYNERVILNPIRFTISYK